MSSLLYRALLNPLTGGVGCGTVLGSIWDDEFACGSSPDLTGARFTGAKAWANYHISDSPGVALTQTSSKMSFNGSYLGGWSPRALLQTGLPAGDWTFRTKFYPTVFTPSFPLIGMILRESATDKALAGGQSGAWMETRRISPWGTSAGANYSGGNNSANVLNAPTYVEVAKTGTNVQFRLSYDVTDGEDLTTPLTTGWNSGSSAISADFTTAPDQIGICQVGDNVDFDWFKRIS